LFRTEWNRKKKGNREKLKIGKGKGKMVEERKEKSAVGRKNLLSSNTGLLNQN